MRLYRGTTTWFRPQILPKNCYMPTFKTLDFLNIHKCFFDFQTGKWSKIYWFMHVCSIFKWENYHNSADFFKWEVPPQPQELVWTPQKWRPNSPQLRNWFGRHKSGVESSKQPEKFDWTPQKWRPNSHYHHMAKIKGPGFGAVKKFKILIKFIRRMATLSNEFWNFSCSLENSRVKCKEHPMDLDWDFSLL